MNKVIEVKTHNRLVMLDTHGELRVVCDMNPIFRRCNSPSASVVVSEREKMFLIEYNHDSPKVTQVSGDRDETPLTDSKKTWPDVKFVWHYDDERLGYWRQAHYAWEIDVARVSGAAILSFPKVLPRLAEGESRSIFPGSPERGTYGFAEGSYSLQIPVDGETEILYHRDDEIGSRNVSDDLVQIRIS